MFNRPAEGGELLDAITFGLQAPDWSIGRVPDGASNWVLNISTPRSANLAAVLGDPTKLKVNEWLANPVPGEDDWFEIYNPNAQPVELSGLHLTDNLTDRTKHILPPLSFIASDLLGFQEFIADDNAPAGADHVNFKLSGSGESIGISDVLGQLLSTTSLSAPSRKAFPRDNSPTAVATR